MESEAINKPKSVGNKSRFVFNVTYHSMLLKLKKIHLQLIPDRERRTIFERVPIIGFRRAKSLIDIIVRANVASLEKKEGCCRSCGGTRCEIRKHIVTTETFRYFSTQRERCIKLDDWNLCIFFYANLVQKQYTGSTIF